MNAPPRTITAHPALPLSRLLNHTADAVQAVRAGQSLNDALARCPTDARPGTQALSFHTLRWLGSALAVRALLAPKAPPPPVDALLLTALALLWPAGEPPYADHALVDQAVAAARQRAPASAAFVNAVLRRFLRERDATVAAARRDPAAAFNHPPWWVEHLQRDWPERWQEVLRADNQRAPMSLRVNARQSDAAGYVLRLAEQGLAARAVGSHGVVLAEPCPVGRLPGFAQGAVSVQDLAAQMAARLLLDGIGGEASARLLPGARVLDACAAPGGKTAHLLECADLDVLALDQDATRLARVTETLARLGLQAQTVAADAGQPQAWWDGRPFDAILLDAPCSASGIVRRHPDVRWLRRASDIAALAATQARLLEALWPLLKPQGRLLYCTCSVFQAEGRHQIDAFLQRHGNAEVALQPGSRGHLLPLADNPSEHRHDAIESPGDGFFYSLIQKRRD
ncbi:MAG: 16S rRNA methyltransferase [Methylibium sp. NZG]|nr:MAG: 16S rRNA methyltransferase [Methylibium sp. NZG]